MACAFRPVLPSLELGIISVNKVRNNNVKAPTINEKIVAIRSRAVMRIPSIENVIGFR